MNKIVNCKVKDAYTTMLCEETKDNTPDEEKTYDYSCVMLETDISEVREAVNGVFDGIDDDDLSGEVNGSDLHVTALYGLHSEDGQELEDYVKANVDGPLSFTVVGLSLFENEEFDVLKYDVTSDDLKALNKELSKLDNTNSFPDFHAHITVAYLKPKHGKKYLTETAVDGKSFDSNEFQISLKGSTDKVHFTV
jgi:2'-5' RNA ligase